MFSKCAMSSSNAEDLAITIAALLKQHFDPVKDVKDEERIINNEMMATEILPNFENADYIMMTKTFGATDLPLESCDSAYNVKPCDSAYKDLYPDTEHETYKLIELSMSGVEPTTEPLKDVGCVISELKNVTMCKRQQDILNTLDYADTLNSITFLENQTDNPCYNLEDNGGAQQILVQQENSNFDNCNLFHNADSLQTNTCICGEVSANDLKTSVPLLRGSFFENKKQSRRKQCIKDISRSLVDDLPEISNPYTDSLDSTSASSVTYTSSSVSVTHKSSGTKKKEGIHECTVCEKKYVYESGLLRHMKAHDPIEIKSKPKNVQEVVVKCTVCGRIFIEPHSSFSHLCLPPYERDIEEAALVLQEETIISSIAVSDLQEPESFKIVILSCLLQCEFCDFVFSDVSYLFVHSFCHLPERRFECMSCGVHVKSSKQLCNHCQAESEFKQDIQKLHQAIRQRYFVCNVCQNKFPSLDLLHEHRYSSSHFFPRLNNLFGTVQLPSEYCEFISDKAHESLIHYKEKHYRRHKREEKEKTEDGFRKARPYLCYICGKSYIQSSHLDQHLRFHQGVKPFACTETGCIRKFSTRYDLNDHTRKCHTGERPYQCLICSKRFLTGPVFYQHRLIHRNEKRYNCTTCEKSFVRKESLKIHQLIHTGRTPFACPFCPRRFKQRGNYARHVQSQHRNENDKARTKTKIQKL